MEVLSVSWAFTPRESMRSNVCAISNVGSSHSNTKLHGDKGVYVEEFELDSNCQKFIGGYSE